MPWCHACGHEYRAGFTHCNDCGKPLSAAPPGASTPNPAAPVAEPEAIGDGVPANWIRVETIADGPADPESELAILAERFAAASIPYQVERLDGDSAPRRGAKAWARIHVPPESEALAREIVAEERSAAREAMAEAFDLEVEPEPADAPAKNPGPIIVVVVVLVVAAIVLLFLF